MTGANIDSGTDAVAGAFGVGMDYFMANEDEKKKIIANNTTLQRDEWESIKDEMISTYRRNAYGVPHLREAGLTRNISLATKVDIWQKRSGITDAEVSMDGENRSDEDGIVYDYEGVPVPIVHKDFRIGDRDLQTSRNLGNDLQTDTVSDATEVVTRKLDDLLFHGWEPSISDARDQTFELYGYTTHPDRNEMTLDGDWDTDARQLRNDIVAMLDRLDEEDRDGGGFWLYLAPEQWRQFRSAVDAEGDGNRTMRSRIEDEFSQEIDQFFRAHHLDDGQAIMIDPSPDVVELAVAEDVQTIEWQSGSGMTHHFKVMAAMTPEIKSDWEGKSGVIHATGL